MPKTKLIYWLWFSATFPGFAIFLQILRWNEPVNNTGRGFIIMLLVMSYLVGLVHMAIYKEQFRNYKAPIEE